jgi:hypothetical protein
MYGDMPAFLKKYIFYVDVRYVDDKILENLSKTALAALACDLDVLDYKLNRRHALHVENDPNECYFSSRNDLFALGGGINNIGSARSFFILERYEDRSVQTEVSHRQ